MKIEITLKRIGSDFYPVQVEKHIYENLDEEYDLGILTIQAHPNEAKGICVLDYGDKSAELSLDHTSYLNVFLDDDHFVIEATLRR